ncbi:MAG: hypothetical protein AAF961_16365, partial [Planctomycetota bacterium]
MMGRRRHVQLVATLVVLSLAPTSAYAGMPSVQLHDLVRLRLEVISFFALGFLLCSGAVQWLWNFLRADFTSLPHLSFSRACGVVGLWGLLFVVVLTMISG